MIEVKRAQLVALAAAAVLGGCSGGDDAADDVITTGEPAPNIVQPGAPGEPSRTLTPEELAEVKPPTYTEADVRFMQGMIHHHAQAIWMTDLVPTRSTRASIELLARRISASQNAEIAQMREWLETRGEETPIPHRVHGHAHGTGVAAMPGMLTKAQRDRLAAADGTAFDRLFLRLMIQHHRGALTMVDRLYTSDGGGVEPAADAFARHVDSDQTIEIARMEQLLAQLRAGS